MEKSARNGPSPSVAILDYGLGNVRSVLNALTLMGVVAHITGDPAQIAAATHLILPGVGSFVQGMEGLEKGGLLPVLQEEIMKKKKPILGICLGMQLFATEGFEHGHTAGLNFISGKAIKLEVKDTVRLPHIGWNDVRMSGTHVIGRGFDHQSAFYFVHSYHLVPNDPGVIAGVCEYGQTFAALVEKGNIFGAQFHPEKSHDGGIRIFSNFLGL